MRSGSLKQVGRLPRFFRPSEKTVLHDEQLGELEIWPGYKASSYVYGSGVYLVLESINKFFRTESCLDKIKEMQANRASVTDIDVFFQEIHVLTGWGTKRPYRISRVRYDLNPLTAKFSNEGTSVSVREYFKDKYQIDLDPK